MKIFNNYIEDTKVLFNSLEKKFDKTTRANPKKSDIVRPFTRGSQLWLKTGSRTYL